MPNWAYNNMTVTSPGQSTQVALHDLTNFIEAIRVTTETASGHEADPDSNYDFTKFHPMPEALRGTRSPAVSSPEPHPNWIEMVKNGEMTKERYDELVAEKVADYEAGQKAKAETGFTDWYNWAVNNWGTKWAPTITNVSLTTDSDEPSVDIWYETAWSPCDGLIAKMSEAFPHLTFLVSVTEEADHYFGASLFRNGVQHDVFHSFDDKSLPKQFAKRIAEASKIVEGDDIDDEKWEEYHEAMNDIRCDIMEHCVDEVLAGSGYMVAPEDRKVEL